MSAEVVSRDFEAIRAQMEVRGGDKRFTDRHGRTRSGRGYSLTRQKLQSKMDEWSSTGRFVSPYSLGVQTDQLNALVALGVNGAWTIPEVAGQMRRQMSIPSRTDPSGVTDWERFDLKRSRSAEGSRDRKNTQGRIYQNFKAMRKLCVSGGYNPKGYKLWQMGCCIDVFVERRLCGRSELVVRYVRLNTHCRTPRHEEGVSGRAEIDARFPVMTRADSA